MYYVSISNDHTGKWIGGVFVNAETEQQAGESAAELAGVDTCLSLALLPVPPGPVAIPGDFYGRLLSRAELARLGALRDFRVDDERIVEVFTA